MAQISEGYPRQLDLTYIYVWNGSRIIKSLAGLDCLEAPDKNLIGLNCLDYSARLDCFVTQIKTSQGWTVLRLELRESIDKGDNEDLV